MKKLLCVMMCLHGLLYAGECSDISSKHFLAVRRTALLPKGILSIESLIPADLGPDCLMHQKSIETGYALRSWSCDENRGRLAGALAVVAEGAQAMALCQTLADVYAEKLKSTHVRHVDPIHFFIDSVDDLNEKFMHSWPDLQRVLTKMFGILVYNDELFVACKQRDDDDAPVFSDMQLKYRGSIAMKVAKHCDPKISWEPNK